MVDLNTVKKCRAIFAEIGRLRTIILAIRPLLRNVKNIVFFDCKEIQNNLTKYVDHIQPTLTTIFQETPQSDIRIIGLSSDPSYDMYNFTHLTRIYDRNLPDNPNRSGKDMNDFINKGLLPESINGENHNVRLRQITKRCQQCNVWNFDYRQYCARCACTFFYLHY